MTNTTDATTSTSEKTYLIEETNFKRLIETGENIYQATHVKPSIRKLVNLIIEQADMTTIEAKLIDQYR
ncbi:MAG: hypothetical protein AAGB12_13345 [Pseudomonadota bacterium]